MSRSGQLSRPTEYLGAVLHFLDGTASTVFRETRTADVPMHDPVLLTIEFRLAPLDDIAFLHAGFRYECLLHTPLFAGFPGFRSKLWLADDATRMYRGIYEWDGEALARDYASRMVALLRPFSNHGTAQFHVAVGLRRSTYLSEPGVVSEQSGDEWWQLREPLVTSPS